MLRARGDFVHMLAEPMVAELDIPRILSLAGALRGGGTACYDVRYMTVRVAGILLALITLCTAALAANRGVGSTPQEQQLSLPTTSARHLGDLPNAANTQESNLVAATAKIDSMSLTTNSANPTITGTASSISEISIDIARGRIIPPSQYDGPGSIPNEVWGYASGNPGFSLSNGHWSATVDYRVHAPVLQPGIYSVAIYGYSQLLTYGTLMVQ
jgi:hypothetical protein